MSDLNLTPTIEMQEQDKSQGHVAIIGNYEYFIRKDSSGKDQLYRSSITNYIAVDGYRAGARWQAPEHMINDYLFLLGLPANYKRS